MLVDLLVIFERILAAMLMVALVFLVLKSAIFGHDAEEVAARAENEVDEAFEREVNEAFEQLRARRERCDYRAQLLEKQLNEAQRALGGRRQQQISSQELLDRRQAREDEEFLQKQQVSTRGSMHPADDFHISRGPKRNCSGRMLMTASGAHSGSCLI